MSYHKLKTKIIEAVKNGLDVFDQDGDKVVFADGSHYKYLTKRAARWPTAGLEHFQIFGTAEKVDPYRDIQMPEWPDADGLQQFRPVLTTGLPRYTAEEIRAALPKNLNFSEKAIAQAVIEQVIANLEKA